MIQAEININNGVLPEERLADIQHYLDHGELGTAFEYLLLEVMERKGAKLIQRPEQVKELALFFDLDDESECTLDATFWPKLEAFLAQSA